MMGLYIGKMFVVTFQTPYQPIQPSIGSNTSYSSTLGNPSSILSKPLRKELKKIAKYCGGHWMTY